MALKSNSFNKSNDQRDWIRMKLDAAEKSGFTKDSKEEILKESKERLKD